jgi:transposase
MRTGIKFEVSLPDRLRLEQVVRDRNAAQKHVWRARIILLSADGVGTAAIMRQTGKSKTCVWRWQERFMAAGTDGLLRDKTRPSRIAPLKPDVIERVVALTLTDAPGETTHWTAVMMASASKISASAVRRIWKAHGLQPHRYRKFKLSNDPRFADKLHDVVGLYVAPPAHAIVLSFDEKSQIQALDRTQPGLPMKKGRLGTMTHDYKRNGTTTLFAALNILDGTVIGRNLQQHRHQEFIRFLNTINASVPIDKAVHIILDVHGGDKPGLSNRTQTRPPFRVQFRPPDGAGMPRFGGFWRDDGDGPAGEAGTQGGRSPTEVSASPAANSFPLSAGDQLRFLKRQESLPVSMISQ